MNTSEYSCLGHKMFFNWVKGILVSSLLEFSFHYLFHKISIHFAQRCSAQKKNLFHTKQRHICMYVADIQQLSHDQVFVKNMIHRSFCDTATEFSFDSLLTRDRRVSISLQRVHELWPVVCNGY